MKASIILTTVKANMQEGMGTSQFICDNVWYLRRDRHITEKDCKRITKFISKLLGGRFSLVQWLIDHGHHDGDEWNINRAKLQATRMAWLDHLIAHYESIGD